MGFDCKKALTFSILKIKKINNMKAKNSILAAVLALNVLTSPAIRASVFFEGTFADAKKRASEESKILILGFTAKWCLPCRFMEKEVFSNPEVVELLAENAIVYKVDIDDFDGMAIKDQYRVKTIPTHVILLADGRELSRKESSLGVQEYVHWVSNHMPMYQAEPSNKNRASTAPTTQNNIPPFSPNLQAEATQGIVENGLASGNRIDPIFSGENYYVQVGVFTQWANAERFSNQLKQRFNFDTQIFEDLQQGKKLYKIALGSFETKEEADLFAGVLHKENLQAVVKKLF